MTLEHDEASIRRFEILLSTTGRARIPLEPVWEAFLSTFPGRDGPAARNELDALLRACEARGSIQLPKSSASWDGSILPPLPRFVVIPDEELPAPRKAWRDRAWHPKLDWVADLDHLTAGQQHFLERIHKGLVEGWFARQAPLKYRSLQLTGHEKRLDVYRTSGLFGPSRLTLDMLGCAPDVYPMAIEKVSAERAILVLENGGAFHVAKQVLRALTQPPYGAVAFAGGNRLAASIASLQDADPAYETIDYLGDLDWEGLSIAARGDRAARAVGLPALRVPDGLHAKMIETAERFGAPRGWPGGRGLGHGDDRELLLQRLPVDLRKTAEAILDAGHRIPEEVLGPDELTAVWRR